jgi:ankyrin repeat protein
MVEIPLRWKRSFFYYNYFKKHHMTRPEALGKDEPMVWSPGSGTDVWEMFCAAMTGDLGTIQSLLQKDPSLIHCHYDYINPLYFAVRENQLHVAAFLLEQKAAPVNSGTPDTLLDMARDRGYVEMQQLLEQAITGKQGSPAADVVAEAIRACDVNKVKMLLDQSPQLLHTPDKRTNQPIHWAVMTRQPEIIDELLRRGADINAQRSDGARPLQLLNGDYMYRGWRDIPKEIKATPGDIFKLLIERGAYLDIYMAAYTGNLARVRGLLDEDPMLVNRLSDYVTYYGGSGSVINNAAKGGHIEIVRFLLERGADPNLPEPGIAPQGHALYSAVSNEDIDMARLLLEHGANPSASVESSANTLAIAISRSNKDMIDLLCSWGASRPVNLLAYYGDLQTAAAVFNANPALANDIYALECAAGQGHELFVRLMLRYHPGLVKEIAVGVKSQGPQDAIRSRALTEFFFEQGMNANLRSWLGVTPLHQFAEKGDIENVAIFLEHGADVNAVDEKLSSTPLGYAAKYGKEQMVTFLLEHGADPNLPLHASWAQPMAWATRRGHHAIVALLQQHSAAK